VNSTGDYLSFSYVFDQALNSLCLCIIIIIIIIIIIPNKVLVVWRRK